MNKVNIVSTFRRKSWEWDKTLFYKDFIINFSCHPEEKRVAADDNYVRQGLQYVKKFWWLLGKYTKWFNKYGKFGGEKQTLPCVVSPALYQQWNGWNQIVEKKLLLKQQSQGFASFALLLIEITFLSER